MFARYSVGLSRFLQKGDGVTVVSTVRALSKDNAAADAAQNVIAGIEGPSASARAPRSVEDQLRQSDTSTSHTGGSPHGLPCGEETASEKTRIVGDPDATMTFPLEQLGPFGFQDLAGALLLKEFGAGLTPMGPGRDGGRDLFTRDKLTWSNADESVEQISGYSVFQIKSKAAETETEDAIWLWNNIREELQRWRNPDGDRATPPTTLVFVTNVRLSAYPESGGRDTIERKVAEFRAESATRSAKANDSHHPDAVRDARLLQIRSLRVLDRTWVQNALTNADSVRKAFPALLTATDAFSMLAELTGRISEGSLPDAFRDHARKRLSLDGAVWVVETGQASTEQIPLHEVIVDLPVLVGPADARRRATIVNAALDIGEHMLKPRLRPGNSKRHLVITGAPGNGKSTTAKFLVQVFRAALLEQDKLSSGQRQIVDGTRDALAGFGRKLPKHKRWPLLIDLKEIMQHRLLDEGGTLMRAIATQLSTQLDAGEVAPNVLDNWHRRWPWFVMLDGFDEVTDPNARRTVIERVQEFVEEAEVADADLMVVLTTRSQGYSDEINPDLFHRIDLDYLDSAEALHYATKVSTSRYPGDAARQSKVLQHLKSAAKNPAQRSLLRTPLQVMILLLIVDSSQRLEPDRYGLFSTYFELAFKRELGKGGQLQRVLDRFEPVIRNLHARIGFELHCRAESGRDPDPVIGEHELKDMIWEELTREGFKPVGKDAGLVDEVFQTALHRLVLLAPHGDGFGFDVRSLQELTAAMWLVDTRIEVVLRRLRLAAVSPHWRNTVLFAAGAIFNSWDSSRNHDLVATVQSLDTDWAYPLSGLFPIAPRLAVEMVDDGMVRNRPARRQELFAEGLRVLLQPPESDYGSVATALIRIALEHPEEHTALVHALASAHNGTRTARRNAWTLQGLAQAAPGSAPSLKRQMIVNVPASKEPPVIVDGHEDFLLDLQTMKVEPADLAAHAAALGTIHAELLGEPQQFESRAVTAVLRSADLMKPMNDALGLLMDSHPELMVVLRREIWPLIARAPVGGAISAVGTESEAGSE